MWFWVGQVPNVVGISSGVTQIIVYFIYRGSNQKVTEATTSETHAAQPEQTAEVTIVVQSKSVESIESDIV